MLKTLDRPTHHQRNDPGKPLKVERITVTPEIARAWLDKNTHNRKVTKHHVAKMARDMTKGRFVFTGDPIRFDLNSDLIDGQHRLLACVEADAPFETTVIYNMAPEIQDKIDAGKSRNASDVISMIGHHSAYALTAACRLALEEKSDSPSRVNRHWSTSEILEVLNRHKELPSSVLHCIGQEYPKGISIPQLSLIHFVGCHILGAKKTADAFVHVISTGVPSYNGDPAHAYRERIIKSVTGSSVLKRTEKWRLFKHAWNLFSVGQPTKNLRGSETVTFDGVDKKSI